MVVVTARIPIFDGKNHIKYITGAPQVNKKMWTVRNRRAAVGRPFDFQGRGGLASGRPTVKKIARPRRP